MRAAVFLAAVFLAVVVLAAVFFVALFVSAVFFAPCADFAVDFLAELEPEAAVFFAVEVDFFPPVSFG